MTNLVTLGGSMKDNHLTWHHTAVDKQLRRVANGHGSFVIWLTGLSGSGKSTIGSQLEKYLFDSGIHTYLLDGDNLRMGMNSDLGFSEQHRQENIRRAGELAKVLVEAGVVVIVALISPYQRDRNLARQIMGTDEFVEVYVQCPLDVCVERDPKGLYRKVMAGTIKNFTGFDSPYEEPTNPELVIPTDQLSVDACTEQVISYLTARGLLESTKAGEKRGTNLEPVLSGTQPGGVDRT
jgi:adenylylsulfate kinase